jgi:spore maturation protein CgeB
MGSKIGIWGNGWEQSQWVPKNWLKGNAIYGEDSTQLLDIAPVALNILRPQNAGSHNMRTFEIPATRHAMLTTRSEEQAQWFDEGAEMECYETPQELLEKIRELTNDPMRRRNIAHAGFERVREETYAKRVRQMLVALGFAC